MDAGRSPYGIFDMAGNVLEWTADREGNRSVVRGGSWDAAFSEEAWRNMIDADLREGALGFRCAADG